MLAQQGLELQEAQRQLAMHHSQDKQNTAELQLQQLADTATDLSQQLNLSQTRLALTQREAGEAHASTTAMHELLSAAEARASALSTELAQARLQSYTASHQPPAEPAAAQSASSPGTEEFETPRSLMTPREQPQDQGSLAGLLSALRDTVDFLTDVGEHAIENSLDIVPEQAELRHLALSQLGQGEKGLVLALQRAWEQKAAAELSLARATQQNTELQAQLAAQHSEQQQPTSSKPESSGLRRRQVLDQMESKLLDVQQELGALSRVANTENERPPNSKPEDRMRVSDLVQQVKESKQRRSAKKAAQAPKQQPEQQAPAAAPEPSTAAASSPQRPALTSKLAQARSLLGSAKKQRQSIAEKQQE
eukprot:TRINITY_DN7949_c0_g1_i2.p1 TRINITY_DN7949_c0_g1~~TRINITY_DN7949_c0_g1_i2.p1  ORF type:complete len:365 (+),score=139.86 TRINITY_DN7949_c0_g1_i2:165-1259(+)